MHIPPSYTETEVVAIIRRAAKKFARKYTFGYFTAEDIEQEATTYAIECLKRYDPEKADLERFLLTHIRRRLYNLKRDKHFRRCEIPCEKCNSGTPCTPEGFCQKYREWFDRNTAKASLTRAASGPLNDGNTEYDVEPEVQEHCMVEGTAEKDAEFNEIRELIDMELPVNLRSDYLRMLARKYVSPTRRELVKQWVSTILKNAGIDCQYEPENVYV